MLKLGVVPILNENDAVSGNEGYEADGMFSDNDGLAALVAEQAREEGREGREIVDSPVEIVDSPVGNRCQSRDVACRRFLAFSGHGARFPVDVQAMMDERCPRMRPLYGAGCRRGCMFIFHPVSPFDPHVQNVMWYDVCGDHHV